MHFTLPKPRRMARPAGVAAVALIAAGALVGCGSDNSDTNTAGNSDAPLASLVPDEYRGTTLAAVDGDSNPPMYSRNAGGEITGITIDLARAAAELLGVSLEVEANSFDASIPGLQSGTYDISLWATDITEDRKKIIDQIPVGDIGYTFLAPAAADARADETEALCGATIAAISGQTTIPVLEAQSTDCQAAGRGAISVSTFPDQASAILAVKSGRADLATVNSVSGVYTAQQDQELQLTGPTINRHLTGIATAKGNGLGEAFAAALQELVDNGTYADIVSGYGADSMILNTIELNPPAAS